MTIPSYRFFVGFRWPVLLAGLCFSGIPSSLSADDLLLSERFYENYVQESLVTSGEPVTLSGGPTLPPPSWYGDLNTTFQSYTFTTSSTTAPPEILENSFGNPEMLVTYVPTGGVGVGYMDPDVPFHIHRDGGAWDLGPEGNIFFDIPVAPPVGAGPGYVIEVYVNVVYEPTAGFYNLPDIVTAPSSLVTTTTDPTFEQDGFFYWGLLTGSSVNENLQGESISLWINATGNTGSLIDAVEVHTRYAVIPEPKVYGLMLGTCFLLIAFIHSRRRRFGR